MKFLATVEIEVAKPKCSADDLCNLIFSELNDIGPFLGNGNFVSMKSVQIQRVDRFE